MAILITIIGLGIMVFIHELGHFIVAKKFGVIVHEFAIGMGPKLFSYGKGETKYSLRLLPLGGYVKLEGETEITQKDDNPRSYPNIKPIKRIAILVAGAAMNIILGWIIFTIVNLNTGISPAIVDSITKEYETVQTVLQPGDKILKLDSTRTNIFDDVSFFMSRVDGDDIKITFKRDDKVYTKMVTPIKTEYGYMLGIGFKTQKCNIIKAAEYAVYDTIYISKMVFIAVGDLITGKQSINALSGPVEIVTVVDSVTAQKNGYTLISILLLFAMITVNLGIFNLLPFPALDGGSIVFALYELIFRKKVKQEFIGYAGFVGFALLMLLAAYVTIGDIRALIK